MEGKILKREHTICTCCMTEHDVFTVEIPETMTFKGTRVSFPLVCYYCDKADEYYESGDMIDRNDTAMKDAYRKKMGLLTSEEIRNVRQQYSVNQTDLSTILGWGAKTITRYESHQVQDAAHDSILRKIGDDPEWFLKLLKQARNKISAVNYEKIFKAASEYFELKKNEYKKRAIEAKYANIPIAFCGGKSLDLNKVVDVIRYYANSSQLKYLFKVKLMKLLWYADILSFKRRQESMTGLAYRALSMGAVPEGHAEIIELDGVIYEEIDINQDSAYKFCTDHNPIYPNLTKEDMEILDEVISEFSNFTKNEIVERMHQEKAYQETASGNFIRYEYAEFLSIG